MADALSLACRCKQQHQQPYQDQFGKCFIAADSGASGISSQTRPSMADCLVSASNTISNYATTSLANANSGVSSLSGQIRLDVAHAMADASHNASDLTTTSLATTLLVQVQAASVIRSE